MNEKNMTEEQIRAELEETRRRIAEIESSEGEREQAATALIESEKRFRILNEISRALSSALELEDLLTVIHEQVGRVHDASSFFISTYEEGTDEWFLAFLFEKGERLPSTRHKLGAGLSGYIIRHREPLLFRNEDELKAFHESQGRSLVGEWSQSWMGVPMIVAEKVVGVMGIQNYEQTDVYDETDLALFSTIAGQAAVAIENARLLKLAQTQADQAAALNEISRTVNANLDLRTILGLVADEVARLVPYDRISLALPLEHDPDHLEMWLLKGDSTSELNTGTLFDLESSAIGWAYRDAKPFVASDLEEEQYVPGDESLLKEGIRSYTVIPLLRDGQAVGTLNLGSTQPRFFGPHNVPLLLQIGEQLAIAIRNARLFETSQRRIATMDTLNEISRALSSALELEELLEVIRQQVDRVFDAASFFVATHEEGTDEWTSALYLEKGVRQTPVRFKITDGLTGHIIRHQEPLLFRSAEEALTFDKEHGIPTIGDPSRSWMGIPLIAGGEIVGVMAIQSYEEEGLYGDEELSLFSTIGAQVAVAIRNSRLYERARVRAEEMVVLNELSRSLTARLEVEQVLEEAHRGASRLLDATNFALGLYDPEKEEIRFPFVVTKSDIDRDVITIPASGGLNGFVVQNREPLLLRSPEEVISFHKARGIEMIGETPTCWLGVPLLHGDRVLGTMFVQTYSRPGLYGEHDLDLLTMIASQVAIAIENAHLFEETQRALEEVREVSERQLRLLDTVRELSTPLVPITDDILVLPLIGAIDSQRAQQILETLLMGATERRARVVILDITGVPVVDTGVANHILQATRALRLVGAECILVGITPEVAQTVVGLGLELQDLVTRSDLQGGVDHALRHVGKQIG